MRQTRAVLGSLFTLFLALVLVVSSVDAQSTGNGAAPTGSGNGSGNCQVMPSLSAGNDPTNSCEHTKAANGYYTPNPSSAACTNLTSSNFSYANGVNFTGITDPGYNYRTFIANPRPTSNPANTAQVVLCDYNRSTGALITTNVLANGGGTLCFGSSNHAEPMMGSAGHGSVIGTACGQTATGNVQCLSTTGGPGTSSFCQKVYFGNCLSTDCGGAYTLDLSLAANTVPMTGGGFSEGTVSYYGGFTVLSGQNQNGFAPSGISAGQQTYTTLRDVPGHLGTQWSEDTACGVGQTVNTGSSGFNIATQTGGGTGGGGTGITQACNGAETFTLPVHGSGMALVALTSDCNGCTFSLTLPTHGAWTSQICKFTETGSATADAPNIVTAMTSGSGWAAGSGSGCSSSGTYWDSLLVTTAGCSTAYPGFTSCVANGSFSVEPINANPNAMAVTACSVTSTGTCAVYDMRSVNAGTWDHFNYGTMQPLFEPNGTVVYCATLDIQTLRDPSNTWSTNGYAFSMGLWCSRGPDVLENGAPGTLGVWHWGDAEVAAPGNNFPPDGFDVAVSPGSLGYPTTGATPSPAPYLQFNMGSSWTSCGSAPGPCTTYRDASGNQSNVYGLVKPCTCTPWTGFVPYIYQSTLRANEGLSTANGHDAPVFSTYWMLIDNNYNVDIVRDCPDNNITGSHTELCFTGVSSTDATTYAENCIDCTNTTVDTYQPQVAATRTPRGTLVAFMVDALGKFTICTSGKYPCFAYYTSVNNGATWTAHAIAAPTGTNTTVSILELASVQCHWDGTHCMASWIAAGGTNGATSSYQYDLLTAFM